MHRRDPRRPGFRGAALFGVLGVVVTMACGHPETTVRVSDTAPERAQHLAEIEALEASADQLGSALSTDHPLVVEPFLEARASLDEARTAASDDARERHIAEARDQLALARARGARL